jgi:ornithine cyclodeaminase
LVGAGHQAWFELKAACAVRPIRRVLVWNRTPIAAEIFARRVREDLRIEASAADLRSAVEAADIVIASTAAREPLVSCEWVRPGTHISAMGSDAVGKGELSPGLIRQGRLFCDVVDQAITLGDFESAFLAGLIDRNDIVPLGAVITGDKPGRTSEADITIFDSSGTALQDLAIGGLVLSKAVAQGLAEQIDTVGA